MTAYESMFEQVVQLQDRINKLFKNMYSSKIFKGF